MKIIDLLNKIANGEEVPKKIKYINSIWEYDENTKDYIHDDLWLIYSMNSIGLTEREVEIIEEPQEHKIPEKLKWVDYNIEFTHRDFNREFRNICNAVDEILDYLEDLDDTR